MDWFAVGLACARGLHLAATASVFGIMVITLLVASRMMWRATGGLPFAFAGTR